MSLTRLGEPHTVGCQAGVCCVFYDLVGLVGAMQLRGSCSALTKGVHSILCRQARLESVQVCAPLAATLIAVNCQP